MVRHIRCESVRRECCVQVQRDRHLTAWLCWSVATTHTAWEFACQRAPSASTTWAGSSAGGGVDTWQSDQHAVLHDGDACRVNLHGRAIVECHRLHDVTCCEVRPHAIGSQRVKATGPYRGPHVQEEWCGLCAVWVQAIL
jgi:hypothetical protein